MITNKNININDKQGQTTLNYLKVEPHLDGPAGMVTFLQGQINRLSEMVSTMQQSRQEGSVSKDMVKEVLVEVR